MNAMNQLINLKEIEIGSILDIKFDDGTQWYYVTLEASRDSEFCYSLKGWYFNEIGQSLSLKNLEKDTSLLIEEIKVIGKRDISTKGKKTYNEVDLARYDNQVVLAAIKNEEDYYRVEGLVQKLDSSILSEVGVYRLGSELFNAKGRALAGQSYIYKLYGEGAYNLQYGKTVSLSEQAETLLESLRQLSVEEASEICKLMKEGR